jgi:hypothetical protein
MSDLKDTGTHAIPLLMQHMAMFFARYGLLITRQDAYSRLVAGLEREGKLPTVLFSTINYDIIFDIALSMAGKTISYFENNQPSNSNITLWKLHGSCNFLPGGAVTATRGVTFSGTGVAIEAGIKAVSSGREVIEYCSGDTALYPAMAIYARDKPIQMSPSIIRLIQGYWTNAISRAPKVVIIGVKPNLSDSHLWQPLSDTPAEIFCVGAKEFEDWASRLRKNGSYEYLGHDFDQSLDAVVENL